METIPPSTPPTPSGPSENQWKVILHLSPLIGIVVPFLGNIIAPLVLWLIKKQEIPGLDATGRQVLNFQISWTIWLIIASVIGFVASCLVVPLLLPLGMALAWLVLTILGGVKAADGQDYRYPLTLKLL